VRAVAAWVVVLLLAVLDGASPWLCFGVTCFGPSWARSNPSKPIHGLGVCILLIAT
jgi:hypothetical protein